MPVILVLALVGFILATLGAIASLGWTIGAWIGAAAVVLLVLAIMVHF